MYSVFRFALPWQNMTDSRPTMTALDVLCLKECKIANYSKTPLVEKLESELAILLYDLVNKNHTFCGLNPVALAMLTGKYELTKNLLKNDQKSINKTFPALGNLVTVLLNSKYNLNLSKRQQVELLILLLESNVNSLRVVEITDQKFRGNACDYISFLSNFEK